MKKIGSKILLLALMLAAFIMAPAVNAKAAEYLVQTKAEKDSVTIQWYTPENLKPYIGEYLIYKDGTMVQKVKNTESSFKISGLEPGYMGIAEVRFAYQGKEYYLDGYTGSGASAIFVRTAPKTKNLDKAFFKVLWDKDEKIRFLLRDENGYLYTYRSTFLNSIDGYEYRIKDAKGKVRKKGQKRLSDTEKGFTYSSSDDFDKKSTVTLSCKAPGSIKNKGMQYQIRTYIILGNEKIYSDWTKAKVAIPQAKITSLKSYRGSDKITVSWKKVSGAKGYTVYKTSDSGAHWKKVKKVGAGTTYCTVTGLRRYDSTSGVRVEANGVKFGKKKYNSTKSYYIYIKN